MERIDTVAQNFRKKISNTRQDAPVLRIFKWCPANITYSAAYFCVLSETSSFLIKQLFRYFVSYKAAVEEHHELRQKAIVRPWLSKALTDGNGHFFP